MSRLQIDPMHEIVSQLSGEEARRALIKHIDCTVALERLVNVNDDHGHPYCCYICGCTYGAHREECAWAVAKLALEAIKQ